MCCKVSSFLILVIVAICNGRRLTKFEHDALFTTVPAPPAEEKFSGLEGERVFGNDVFDDYDDVMEGFFPEEPDNSNEKPPLWNADGMNSDDKDPKVKFPVDDYEDEEESGDKDKTHKEDRFPSDGKKDGKKFEQDDDKDTPESDESEQKGDSNGLFDEDGYKSPSIRGGILLDTPFFNLEQMARYVKQLERAMEQVFRQTVEEALLLNGTYANTTEEEIDVDGKKFLVQKSVIQGGDNSSSILIEAIETKAETNRTKRSNWFSEEAQKPKRTEP